MKTKSWNKRWEKRGMVMVATTWTLVQDETKGAQEHSKSTTSTLTICWSKNEFQMFNPLQVVEMLP